MKSKNILFLALCILLFGVRINGQNPSQVGEWSNPIPFGIVPVAVANLPDGRLLCWSSQFRNTFITSGDGATFTEIFDPFQGTDGLALGEFTSNTNHDMFCPGINNLADGRILAAGGTSSEKTSIYNWQTGLWTVGDVMNIPRGYQGNVTLSDGSVFTVGGSWSGGAWTNRDAEIWTEASGWQLLPNVKGDDFYTANDAAGDSFQSLYRADNHIWLWGAPDGSLFHAGPSELMHWINTSGNGAMVSAGFRSNDDFSMKGTTVMFDIGKILKVGGAESYDDRDPANDNSYVIDINGGYGSTPTVTPTNNKVQFPRTMHNSTVLPNGEVLITGGLNESLVFSDSGARLTGEIFNPGTNSWRNVAGMQIPRTYHSVAILMVDGRVFVGGGGLCNGSSGCVNHFDAEIFSPPYLFNSSGNLATRPTINAPDFAGYNSTINVSGTSGIQQFSLIRFSSATHSTNNEQRRIPVSFTANGGNYNVNIPNRNLLPPGYYMLFAIDGNGVPSVAEVVRVDQGAPSNCNTVASPWTSGDIGGVSATGSSCVDGSTYELEGSGSDIWGGQDEFHFMYQSMSGDGEIVARVVSMDNTHPWAKAGVMMRNGLSANSATALLSMHPNPQLSGSGYTLQTRGSDGSTMNNIGPSLAGFPRYLRLVRSGSTFTAYGSSTNGNWQFLGSRTVSMGNDIYVGLAVTSHNDGTLCRAVFDNVSVQGSSGGGNQPPVALAQSDVQNGTVPLTVNFTGSGSSDDTGITSYSWDFGDGNGSSTADPQHTYNSSGSYTATLTVTDGDGASDSDSIVINTTGSGGGPCPDGLPNDDVSVALIQGGGFQGLDSFSGTSTVTNGSPCGLSITNNDGGQLFANYRIKIDLASNGIIAGHELFISLDGNSSSGVARIELNRDNTPNTSLAAHTYVGGWSTYSSTVTVPGGISSLDIWLYSNYLSSGSGTAYYDNLTVTNLSTGGNQPPVALAQSDVQSGTAPLTVNFTGSGSSDDTGITSYSWDFGDGNGSSTADPQHTYNSTGNYTATLTVTDGDGASDSDSIVITVNSSGGNQPPVALAQSDVQNGTAPLTVNFTGSGSSDDTGITSYSWDFGDGNGSSTADPQHTYNSSGSYTATLTVTDGDGASDSDSIVINTTGSGGGPCPDGLPNDDVSVALIQGGGFQGLDSFSGTSTVTNGSPCGLSITNNDGGQLFANYRIKIDLASNGIIAGHELFISLDGNSSSGVARIELNRDNTPNTSLAAHTYVGGWSTYSSTVTVPGGISSLDIWLYSNYLSSGSGTAYYDNLTVTNLSTGGNQPPVALAQSDVQSGTAPLTVNFTGSGSSDDTGITSYSWDFGDGNGSSTADPQHTYNSTGNYTATLTVTDGDGASDSDSIVINATGSGGGGCLPIASPWTSGDIGGVSATGSSCVDGSTYELEGSGSDIWGGQDEFHFMYQSMSGDGEIVARVVSMDNTHPWAKAGVMMRNGLSANSATALLSMHPNPQLSGSGYTLQTRGSDGSTMNNIGPSLAGFPRYLRLVRSGSTFTAYGSSTNGNWQFLGSRTVSMGNDIYVGLAVTSHNDGTLCRAVFDNVSVQGSSGGGNQPPVALAQSDVQNGTVPLTVNFTGSGSSDDTGITSYSWDFGDGNGSSTADPQHTYNSSGSYTATLTVTDGDGASDSGTIAIQVNSGGGGPIVNDNDLIVHLNFEETSGASVSDDSGFGNNFTVIERDDFGNQVTANDHSWGNSGVFGNSLEMDGEFHTSNSILELPYNSVIDDIANQITISTWVWRDAGSIIPQTGKAANVSLFAHDYPAIFAGFHNWLVKYSIFTTNGFSFCYAGHAPLNQWVHYSMTYDGQTVRLYSNGVEICNQQASGQLLLRNDSTPNSRFTVSGFYEHRTNLPVVPYGNQSAITDELDGRMDDFRIYRRALNSQEIQSIYQQGLNTGTAGIADCTNPPIVAQYKIGASGAWTTGNTVVAPIGSQVFIRAQGYGQEYFITTPTYDGPTISSVNNTNMLTSEGAYQLDTFAYGFGEPGRNDGVFDSLNVGQYALTTANGCPTVINVVVGSSSLQTTLGDMPVDTVADIIINPNPGNSLIQLHIPISMETGSVSLFDINGRLLKTIAEGNLASSIDFYVDKYPEGVYLIVLEHDGKKIRKKLLIQR